MVGFDRATIDKLNLLTSTQIYLTLGWHPTEAGTYDEEVENYLLKALQHPKVIALGEIGLDYYWMTADKRPRPVFSSDRWSWLSSWIYLCGSYSRCWEDTRDHQEVGVGPRGGIMHSFSGTLEEAQAFMDLVCISFSGVVTFRKPSNFRKRRDIEKS